VKDYSKLLHKKKTQDEEKEEDEEEMVIRGKCSRGGEYPVP